MPLVGAKCPIYKKNIRFEQCLKCAIDNNSPCSFPYSYLKASSVLMGSSRPDIHVTDLTGCLRRAYFSKVTNYYEEPSRWMAAVLGILIHSGLEKFAPPNSDIELSLSAITLSGIRVVGRIDLLVNTIIRDTKSKRWLMPEKLPTKENERQINIYAWLLSKNGYVATAGVLEYLALGGATRCRKCNCLIDWNKEKNKWVCPECKKTWGKDKAHRGAHQEYIELYNMDLIETWVDEKASVLDNALKTGAIAPKIDTDGEWLCDYCAFIDECKAFDSLLT